MDIVVPAVNLSDSSNDKETQGASHPLASKTRDNETSAVGFLAKTDGQYAEGIRRVFAMDEGLRDEMAERARQRAAQFSEEKFDSDFKDGIRPLLERMS